ncbi:MAG: hypothetical protein IPF99_19855, partial [Deltaproteobacteria bacterium]|nr:hypothetical protein [Deltaproteobacteria bacterium]
MSDTRSRVEAQARLGVRERHHVLHEAEAAVEHLGGAGPAGGESWKST